VLRVRAVERAVGIGKSLAVAELDGNAVLHEQQSAELVARID
jgi:hypothetical protein